MFGLNYEGLKKKEPYDEIVDYLMNKHEQIKMQNRVAKQLRNSPQLSNLLDGDSEGLLEMEGQQKRATQEIEKEQRIRETADTGSGPTENKTSKQRERKFKPKATREFGGQTTDFPKVGHDVRTQVGAEVINRGSQANPKMATTKSQTYTQPRVVSEEGVQTESPNRRPVS